MKKICLLTLSTLLLLAGYTQTNESPMSLYNWKKKKTTFQKGYIVLKSGKRLEGEISLQGNSNQVKSLQYIGDGKEIDFPMTALSAYGLSGFDNTALTVSSTLSSNPICDNNEELFTWRQMGEVMGKKVENTKPRNGYIVKRDGTRLEGELQLKKLDGVLTDFKLKTSSGKVKLKAPEVANYGLETTVNQLTNNGLKAYKDAPRNFQTGSVNLKNGKVISGLVAFRKRSYLDKNKTWKGYKYNGLFFATTLDDLVKTYSDNEIEYVMQAQLRFSPYDGGFIAENALDNIKFTNKLKMFNTGTLTLAGGNVLKGNIAQVNDQSLRFKNADGSIKLYQANEIERFDVSINGERKAVINLKDELTEELFNGKTFWAYNNPHPTTVNRFKTDMAKTGVSVGSSATSAMIISKDEEKQGYETNLDSVILHSDANRLREVRDAFLNVQGYKTSQALQDNSSNETAKKYDAALNLAISGKEAANDAIVYYKEIIVINKTTNEQFILYKKKKDSNAKLDGLLKGCYTFLSLSKNEQKPYYDIDNLANTMKMLDECY